MARVLASLIAACWTALLVHIVERDESSGSAYVTRRGLKRITGVVWSHDYIP